MEIPKLSLKGLKVLTDEVGILHHSKYSIVDRNKGYTTDDNARALISSIRYHRTYGDMESMGLAKVYLAFLLHMQRKDGKFHNLMGFDRTIQDDVGSEDCMGHALWACGSVLASDAVLDLKRVAKEIFDRGLPVSREFTSPRARAFTILGLCKYYESYSYDSNLVENIKTHSNFLTTLYSTQATKTWPWFEPYLTYANPRLPQSLLVSYQLIDDHKYFQVGKNSFDFLVETQMDGEFFMPIGTNGWYEKNGEKAVFDQQPIEASCMTEAAVSLYTNTNEAKYREIAVKAFNWFHGMNVNGVSLFNSETSTCYDGITSKGLNENQGAESTISYYMAYLVLKENGII